jgi:SAM-dependent methyltransferase
MSKTTTAALDAKDALRDDYVLGHSESEHERLRDQAHILEPQTARLFDRCGPTAGARCLDAGCGPGETMRLMAERVGPTGAVTGIDVDPALGAEAIEMLHAAGHRNCRFEAIDVERDGSIAGGPFDLVFARLLLLHVDDPAAVLRHLWSWVAPGGRLVLQDYDLRSGGEAVPELATVEEFRRVVIETFRAAGRDLRIGPRLPALHAEAGIGAPDGIDAAAYVAPLAQLAPQFEAVYRSVLPAALRFGVTTRARAEQWLETFGPASAEAAGHTAIWPLMVATWKQKDATSAGEA